MKISVICVYNNVAQLNAQLLASLSNQTATYEFVPIDNTAGRFTSAAAALNYGASVAEGDILIFSHQDIFFKTEHELWELADRIAQCETGTIIGTQGVKEPSMVYYENLTAGKEYNAMLQSKYEKGLYEVSCVDEGLFGMTRATWAAHPFDETLCDNWHLYAVEACLWARAHGNHVYVYPAQIHHFSWGRITRSYMRGLVRVADQYRKNHRYIWTTCYKVSSSWLYVRALYFAWVVNRIIRGRPLD